MIHMIGYPQTQEQLFLEYARVINLCEEYVFIQPFHCVRGLVGGEVRAFSSQPTFKGPPTSYVFAVGILEDTPVFRDTVVFDKKGGQVALPRMSNEDILSAFASDILTLNDPSPVSVTLVRLEGPKRRPQVGEYVRRGVGARGHRGFFECIRPGQWLEDEEICVIKEEKNHD